jgi:hypothetical protein
MNVKPYNKPIIIGAEQTIMPSSLPDGLGLIEIIAH